MGKLEKILEKKFVISSQEASKILGGRKALSRMAIRGEIVPLGAGFYTSNEVDNLKALLKIVTTYYPQCVISNKTALTLYGLGLDPISEIDVDIPRNTFLKNSILNVHRVSTRKMVGITVKIFLGVKVKIYSPERCLYEAYKLGKFSERFFRAIKRYRSKFKINYNEIAKIDETFNTNILAHVTQEDVNE